MKMVEADNRIVLDKDGSYIENKRAGNRISIRLENGCFMFDLWVPAAKSKDGSKTTGGKRGQTRTPNKFAAITPDDNDTAMDTSAVFVRQEA